MFRNIFGHKSAAKKVNIPDNVIVSPFNGQRVDFETIDDFVFSKGLMGRGVAIHPNNGDIYSPVSGKIVVIAHTKHAIGIITDTGIEVLIHIGYKTELLNGKEFNTTYNVGDRINVGDKIVSYKYEEMVKRGFDLTTMIIVTNTADYKDVKTVESSTINLGDMIIEVHS